TAALLARTASRRSPRGGSPRLPPAGRAACAAARLRGRRPFAQNAGLLEERANRIGRQRALLEPGPRLLGVHIDDRRIGFRIVIADGRHKPPVARRLGVRDDDSEIGLTFPSHPAQPNSSCHVPTSFSRTCSFCASAGTVPAACSLPAPD